MSEQLPKTFGFTLTGAWPETSLFIIAQAVADFCQVFHLTQPVQQNWLRQLSVSLQSIDYGGLTSYRHIRLNPRGLTTWTVVHEFGHAWDASQFWALSWRLLWATRSRGPVPVLHQLWPLQKSYWYRVGSLPPPCGCNRDFNRFEDFAESVAAYVYPEEAHLRAIQCGFPYEAHGYASFLQTLRAKFISLLIDQ